MASAFTVDERRLAGEITSPDADHSAIDVHLAVRVTELELVRSEARTVEYVGGVRIVGTWVHHFEVSAFNHASAGTRGFGASEFPAYAGSRGGCGTTPMTACGRGSEGW